MARDVESKLARVLKDANFSFMERGTRTIEEIYVSVRNLYPNLCDDSYYCAENCSSGNNQPEWNHTVRNALKSWKTRKGSFRYSGRRGYWEFF